MKTKKYRTRYQIWNQDRLCPAYVRRPKNPDAIELKIRTIEEAKKGIRWFIPLAV